MQILTCLMSILYLPEAQIYIRYSHTELQTQINIFSSPKEEHKTVLRLRNTDSTIPNSALVVMSFKE